MKRWLMTACAFAAAFVVGQAQAQNVPGPTLANVLKKGKLECAVSSGTPGFGYVDSKGEFRGLDADTCRAVAAAVSTQVRVCAAATEAVPTKTRTTTSARAR